MQKIGFTNARFLHSMGIDTENFRPTERPEEPLHGVNLSGRSLVGLARG